MCEILIKAGNNKSNDSQLDKQMYKNGDIVFVADDGHEWSDLELDTSVFNVEKIPGINKDIYDKYMEVHFEKTGKKRNKRNTKAKESRVKFKRRFKFVKGVGVIDKTTNKAEVI